MVALALDSAVLASAHADHKQRLEWAGGDFDPEEFDPARVDALVREFYDNRPPGKSAC